MAAFQYKALDAQGASVGGVIQGDSAREVRLRLRDQGLTPLEVSAASTEENPRYPWFGIRRLGSHDLAVLTRHLATLLLSGIPLDMALQAAATQSESRRVTTLLLGVRSRVVAGQSLASSLAAYPGAFDDLYRAMVRAGEESGRLGEVLDHLAEYTETRQYTQQRMTAALFYPLALMMVAVSVVGLLMVYVVPKLVRLFEYSKTELPLLTRGLIHISHFLAQGGALGIIIVIVAGIVAWNGVFRDPVRRLRLHAWYLRVPFLKNVIKTLESARFAGTLGILVASGVPLVPAMKISAAVLRNLAMRQAASEAATRLESGGSLSRALETSGVFPPMMVHMVASGELSGELDAMLNKVASHQERQMELLNQTLLSLFEPLLILVMGGVVLLIVLAVLVPIFDMNTLVR